MRDSHFLTILFSGALRELLLHKSVLREYFPRKNQPG
jgi:hypothetical protein